MNQIQFQSVYTVCVFNAFLRDFNVLTFALGKTWQDKVDQIKTALEKQSMDAVVVSALDEIAC